MTLVGGGLGTKHYSNYRCLMLDILYLFRIATQKTVIDYLENRMQLVMEIMRSQAVVSNFVLFKNTLIFLIPFQRILV